MDSIIFDVDGTLWDSTPIVAKAWTEVFARETDYQMVFSAETLQALFGRTLPVIADILMPDLAPKRRMEIIDACCAEEHQALLSSKKDMTFSGVKETIAKLAERYPLFLVSNCEAGYIDVFLQCTGLGAYFKDATCPGDTGMAKAENISHIVSKHNLKSPIYVGDTSGDENASHKAGLPFIHAAYGFGTATAPEDTISNFSDLLKFL